MRFQYKNYYFIEGEGIRLVYDFERNKIISYPENICINKIIDVLQKHVSRELLPSVLSEEELNLFIYLSDNLKEISDSLFDSFSYLQEDDFRVTSASLLVAQNCNLCCTYCYGGKHGQYHSKTQLMSKEVAEKAILFLVKNNSSTDNEIMVNFFGGEPLLNFDLIKYVVQLCKTNYPENHFVFSLTTNATLITPEIANFFLVNKFLVMVSIDGYEKIHNFHRKHQNGNGSFSEVMNGIHILKEYGVSFRIRATLDHRFYDSYEKVNKFLCDLGSDRVIISRLINYNDDDLEFPIDVSELKKEREYLQPYVSKVVNDILKGKQPKNLPQLSSYRKIIFAERSLISCGAYKGGTAISSDGKLYPCHRFVGMKNFDFGDIFNGVDKNKLKKQLESLDYNTAYCNKCYGKYICQRSCLRDLAKSGGKYISHPEEYCKLLKETIDESLISYYNLLINSPEFFNTKLVLRDIE